MSKEALVKTLDFQLDIRSDNEGLLREATKEARSVYNETIRLAKRGHDRKSISADVTENTGLLKNTTQRIVAKALSAMESYERDADVGLPSHNKEGRYPLRANYEEGYDLELRSDDEIAFRISAMPYRHVTGVLTGSDAHLEILKSALSSDTWKIGTAETLVRGDGSELHICVRKDGDTVRRKGNSQTVVGVDVNEDNVALTALSEDGIEDTLIIEFPEIKFERHRYLTIRKRVQKARKDSIHRTLENNERQFVRDRLHKVSRHIVRWSQQFEKSCIVFEDLKEMRENIDYGTRMNRRLHHLPFRTLQQYTSYKAAFEGIPTAWINPKYTSQACSLTSCEHRHRANRNKRRFKCCSCGHQDHADRNASVNIAKKGVNQLDWNVPALNNLPVVRKVRRQATGAVDAPTVTHITEGDQSDDGTGVLR